MLGHWICKVAGSRAASRPALAAIAGAFDLPEETFWMTVWLMVRKAMWHEIDRNA
jgi:hypothetical protein